MCPFCEKSQFTIKRGTYKRYSDNKKINRYHCKSCNKSFSDQTLSSDYRLRKRDLGKKILKLINEGISQRGCARILGVNKKTVSSRVKCFSGLLDQQKHF